MAVQAAQSASSTAHSTDGMPAWQLARRQRIVDAALEALERQDYDQIQIRDVAAAADVALGTLYRYFSSKEHLYAAVLLQWALLDPPRPRPVRKASERSVRDHMHAVIKAFEKQPQFYKVQVLLQRSTDANAKALWTEFAESAQTMLARDFVVLGPAGAADAAMMLWAVVDTMLSRAVYRGESIREVYRIADKFIDLLSPQLTSADSDA